MPQLLYQRWLNLELPGDAPPMWSFPLPLRDGRALVTFLFRPLTNPATPPRTVILELSAEGESKPWGPGVGYPAAVMFYGDAGGVLYGFDLTSPEKVYACDAEGRHVATLAMTLKLCSLVAPEFFAVDGGEIFWIDRSGRRRQARIDGAVAGGLENERAAERWPELRDAPIRFPHTHVAEGKIFVFDFDPMARVSVYAL